MSEEPGLAFAFSIVAGIFLIFGLIYVSLWAYNNPCSDGYVYVKTDTLKGCVTPGDAQTITGEK